VRLPICRIVPSSATLGAERRITHAACQTRANEFVRLIAPSSPHEKLIQENAMRIAVIFVTRECDPDNSPELPGAIYSSKRIRRDSGFRWRQDVQKET
jgi:hypothetical protein